MPLLSDPTKRIRFLTILLVLATFVVVIWIAVGQAGTNASVRATRDSVERTDCARAVNADLAKARDEATLADRAVTRFYFKAVFNAAVTGEEVTQEQIDAFGSLLTVADAADKVVAQLPDPALEVDRRCPS